MVVDGVFCFVVALLSWYLLLYKSIYIYIYIGAFGGGGCYRFRVK